MKKTIYFHIGAPKTGTSSIQQFVYTNKELLRSKYGLDFPNIPEEIPLMGQNTLAIEHKDLHADLFEYLDNSPYERFLFSHERMFHAEDFPFFYNRELQRFNVKIIVFLRNPAEILASLWGELLRVLHLNNANKFVTTTLENVLRGDYYKKRLARLIEWRDYFAEDSIIIKAYEKERFKEISLYQDFLSIFDIPLTAELLIPPKQNLSESRKFRDVISLIRPAALFKDFNEEEIDYLMRNITGDERNVIETISDEMLKEVCDSHEEIISKLELELNHGEKIFINKYPSCYGKERAAYIPLAEIEREKVFSFVSAKPSVISKQPTKCRAVIRRMRKLYINCIPSSKKRRRKRFVYRFKGLI